MKFAAKPLFAATLLVLAHQAGHAGTITVQPGETAQGLTLVSGKAVLSFSEELVAALNIGNVKFSAAAPATVSEEYSLDPIFGTQVRSGVKADAPLSSMTVDDVSGEVLRAGSQGGATLTIAPLLNISLGGSVTVANLSVDLSQKRVYADLTGNFTGTAGGAVTTQKGFHLWDYTSLEGPTNVQVGAGSYTNVISGLKITAAGLESFTSALRLYSTGRTTLATVSDYGSITSTIVASGTLVMPQVPEPGTWALMGLGLVGIAAAAQRRRAG